MNAEQLWDTTMNPEYRTLRKIVVEIKKGLMKLFLYLWETMFHLENLLKIMLFMQTLMHKLLW